MIISPRKAALVLVSAAIVGSVLSGCSAPKTVEETEYSGFLQDYSKLKPEETASGTPVMRYISPDLKKGNYDKVYLESAVLFLGKEQKPSPQVSQQTMDEIVAYVNNAQKAVLQSKLALANEPGPRTLRFRSAITAVTAQTEGLKAYEVIPVALVFAGASTAAGTRDSDTAIYVEGEVTDSQTGALLGEFVRKDAGPSLENKSTQLTLKDVQPVLDKWAQDMYTTLKANTQIP